QRSSLALAPVPTHPLAGVPPSALRRGASSFFQEWACARSGTPSRICCRSLTTRISVPFEDINYPFFCGGAGHETFRLSPAWTSFPRPAPDGRAPEGRRALGRQRRDELHVDRPSVE